MCFEQELETRCRYALVKKKWSEEKGAGTNHALGAMSGGGMDADNKKDVHRSRVQ